MDDKLLVSSTAPLGHCWGCGDRLLVYSHADRCIKQTDSEAAIHEVRWGVSMSSNEFMRRLAKTSYDVFCGVQENTDPEKFISFSVQYRAALAVCSQEILQFLKLNDQIDEPKAMHLAAECELVQSLELIWHLAELIFIQAFPSGHLAYSLCNWFHVQSQEAADNARLLIEQYGDKPSSSRPEQDERFWSSVITLVLQARPHEAASLLAIHSHANSRMLRSIRQLLVALPIASQARTTGMWGKSGTEFSQAWNYWQSECNRRLVTGEFEHVGGDDETTDHVQLIISILSGSPTAWEDARVIEVTGGPRGWYFRFVSFLFYTDQMVTVDGLCGHLNRWLSNPANAIPIGDVALDEVVDDLVTSVFHLNLQQFVRTAGEKLSSRWLVAHFTHLLHRVYPDVLCSFSGHESGMNQSGMAHTKVEEMDTVNHTRSGVTALDRKNTLPLSEFFLVGYAESLASDPSLLSLALGYLDHCESGPERQSTLLLAHGVPTTTRAVNWLMSQANSRGLHSTGERLAKMATRRFLPLALNDSSLSADPHCLPACTALGWAMLARDHPIIHRLAEQTLSRDPGFTRELGGQSNHFPTVPTEVAEMAAIVLGFCKDRSIQGGSNNLEGERIDSVPQLIHLSPELAFLVRYAELQQCFTEGNAESAVDRLIDLLVTGSGGSSSIPVTRAEDQAESCAKVSTRLRLRLLSEVRHLLGKQCIRRDQVELLISALTELRLELSVDEPSHTERPKCDPAMLGLLSQFHVSLARELASTFLRSTVSNPAIQQTAELF